MQIDNLHDMSKPIFWEKNYNQFVVCWISPENVEDLMGDCDNIFTAINIRF